MKKPILLVFLIVLLDAIIAFAVSIVIPDFFKDYSNTQAAFWLTMTSNIFFVMQLISSPILGTLSDRWGRKRVILISEIGTVISNIFLLPKNLGALILNRTLDGTTNGMYSAVNAYVSDVSSTEDAPRNLGLVGAVFGLAAILGPAIAFGLLSLADTLGLDGSYTVIITGLILGVITIMLVLQLPEDNHKKEKIHQPILKTYLRSYHYIISRPKLKLIVLIQFVLFLGVGYYVFFVAFLTQSSLNYDIKQAGFTLLLFGVANTISQTLFFTKILPKINRLNWLGYLSFMGTLGLVGYSIFGSTPGVLETLIVIDSLSFALLGSLMQGFINEEIEDSVKGEIFGFIQALGSVATIFTGLVTTGLLLIDIRYPWLWFALCWCAVFVLTKQFQQLHVNVPKRVSAT